MTDSVNKKRSLYNILYSAFGQIVTIAFGVILPKLFIVSFGSEVNGLLSSVTQVFVYVNLLEAGVGTATLQALYGPVARKEKQDINQILAATHHYYKKAGMWYFIAVVVLSVGYPLVVKSELDFVTVAAVVFLSGIGGVINFFFQGKYRLILQAEGKGYIVTNLTTLTYVATSVAKIVLIMVGLNVIVVLAISFLISLVQMLYIVIYIKRRYKWLDLKVKPNYDAIAQKNSVLVHQVSTLIFNNTDVLILTLFCDLKVVSVYTMYRTILGVINTFMETIGGSVQFALGQTYNVDKERYIRLHDAYETCSITLLFALYSVAYIFILPFLRVYTAGVEDVNYIDTYLPILFIATFLLSGGRYASNAVITFAGHFRKTQWRSMLESAINLTTSLVSVHYLGIYGVLIGTVCALLYRTNDMIIYANRVILQRGSWCTYRRWIINLLLLLLTTFASSFLHPNLNDYLHIVLYAALYAAVILPAFFLVSLATEPKVFKTVVDLLLPKVKKYLKKSEN